MAIKMCRIRHKDLKKLVGIKSLHLHTSGWHGIVLGQYMAAPIFTKFTPNPNNPRTGLKRHCLQVRASPNASKNTGKQKMMVGNWFSA
jgi:hypothetical protein